jgi:RNA-directed DNA polymerase
MLCNAVLNGIEPCIRARFPLKPTKGIRHKTYISRFADDIVITGTSVENLLIAKNILTEFLKERGLTLKEAKTRIVKIEDGFDFLGFNISRKAVNLKLNKSTNQKSVLIIKPSTKAVRSVSEKIRTEIKNTNNMAALIKVLNPIIRG